MKYKYTLLLLTLLCCEFGEETPQGPPEAKDEKRRDSDDDREFEASVEDVDGDPNVAMRVVPAPDLGKDRDDAKDEDGIDVLILNKVKAFQRVMQDIALSKITIDDEEEDADLADFKEDESPPEIRTTASPEQEEALSIYNEAMTILRRTKPDRTTAYQLLNEAATKGNENAKAALAWAILFGNPVEQNLVEAKATFETLAANGDPYGHAGLGFLYASGLTVNASQPRALVHFTIAAIAGNTWAQMALGYRYWSGVTVAPSCEKALGFYRRVADKVSQSVSFGGGPAIQKIRLLDELENVYTSTILDNDLIEYYQLLAEKGDIQAQVGLGQIHYQGGRGVDLDYQKAMHYFTQAANAGNSVAMAYLGKIYLDGSDDIKADNETAFKYFKKASDLNNPVGLSGLGLMYLHGRGVERDYSKALKYFAAAADQGWVDGQLQLGNMYFRGLGVHKDYKKASKYFSLASQSGHVLAYYNLGQMHAEGTGMLRSCTTAVELFKNVAERGRWGELLMQAHTDYGRGRYNEAFVQYAFLAELGYEAAQSNAAFLLDRDEVPMFDRTEDLVRALLYWRRAAAQGYSAAQVKLGDYYFYGLGTAVDYETAGSHYRLASDQQHNAQAMFNLGYMHEQGLGMSRDMHLAKRWYDQAAETSNEARVPVALALLKLNFVFTVERLKESRLTALLDPNAVLGSNWDLYLITTLTVLLATIIYMRRPQAVRGQ